MLQKLLDFYGKNVDNLGNVNSEESLPRQKLLYLTLAWKVVDFLDHRKGKIDLFGVAGVGKYVLIMELINRNCKGSW